MLHPIIEVKDIDMVHVIAVFLLDFFHFFLKYND